MPLTELSVVTSTKVNWFPNDWPMIRQCARNPKRATQNLPHAVLFAGLVKIDHSAITELSHILMMDSESKKLTREEFASLLKVAHTSAVLEPPAVIPAEHSARLIGLGYMADLDGRLRMTIGGRVRIAAAENQNRPLRKSN
jgi:hypothetical protein